MNVTLVSVLALWPTNVYYNQPADFSQDAHIGVRVLLSKTGGSRERGYEEYCLLGTNAMKPDRNLLALLRNVNEFQPQCTVSYPRRRNSSCTYSQHKYLYFI